MFCFLIPYKLDGFLKATMRCDTNYTFRFFMQSSLVKGATAFIHLFILFVEWLHGGGVEVHATGCCWLNILLHAIGVWRWVAVGCSLDEWLSLNFCDCFIVVDKWMFPWFTNHVNIVFLCWVAQELKDCTYFWYMETISGLSSECWRFWSWMKPRFFLLGFNKGCASTCRLLNILTLQYN